MPDPDHLPEQSSYDFLEQSQQDWPSGGSTFEPYAFAVRDVDVTPDGLTDFASLVGSDADHHYTSWLHGAAQASERVPQFGKYSDGNALNQAYFNALSSLHKLMQDVGTGLGSLKQAATNIAEAYAGSDDASEVGFSGIGVHAVGAAFGELEPWDGNPRPQADPYDRTDLREQAGEDFDRLQDGDSAGLTIEDTDLDVGLAEGSAAQDATQPTLDAVAEDAAAQHTGAQEPVNPSPDLSEFVEDS